jgi:hypothetical protein
LLREILVTEFVTFTIAWIVGNEADGAHTSRVPVAAKTCSTAA